MYSQKEDWLESPFRASGVFRHWLDLRVLLLLALAVLFLTIFWQSFEQLEGELYDPEARVVVPAAKVILANFLGEPIDSALTDTTGRFYFSVKQRQIYSLRISKDGYAPRTVIDTEYRQEPGAVLLRIEVRRLPSGH